MIFCDPDVELVFGEVGDVPGQRGRVMVHRLAHEDPAHVRPPLAVDGGMGIAILVRELMMNTVRGHPEDRPALECQRGTYRKQVLHPLRRLIAAMGEQAVIAHADAQAARDPPQKHCDEKCLPGEKEECRDRSNVEQSHEGGCDPVDFTFCGLRFFQILQFHFQERPSVLGSSVTMTLSLSYQYKVGGDCNTCVIAGFGSLRG